VISSVKIKGSIVVVGGFGLGVGGDKESGNEEVARGEILLGLVETRIGKGDRNKDDVGVVIFGILGFGIRRKM
jgi:hypothetical protein